MKAYASYLAMVAVTYGAMYALVMAFTMPRYSAFLDSLSWVIPAGVAVFLGWHLTGGIRERLGRK